MSESSRRDERIADGVARGPAVLDCMDRLAGGPLPRFEIFVLGLATSSSSTTSPTWLRNAGRERSEGLMDRGRAAGLSVPGEYQRMGDFRETGGYQEMLALLGNLTDDRGAQGAQ